jgi:hypothetical protein
VRIKLVIPVTEAMFTGLCQCLFGSWMSRILNFTVFAIPDLYIMTIHVFCCPAHVLIFFTYPPPHPPFSCAGSAPT